MERDPEGVPLEFAGTCIPFETERIRSRFWSSKTG
jgi:hypothetical protein